MKRQLRWLAAAASLPLVLTACVGGTESSSGGSASAAGGAQATGAAGPASGEINYWLWDANQLPAYQACATAFQQATPGVTVKVEQFGWDDYWTKITAGFVSGTAPDVFTDHLSKYPEFVNNSQLLALDELATRDGVKTDIYQPGLAELWVASDNKRYGFPKDFDTIAIFYNQALVEEAGLTEDELGALEWNPTDGGSYEAAIAKLTVDVNGVRGDEPGFDPNNVKTYGLGLAGAGAGFGQTEWSPYALSNGWEYTDEPTWGTSYNYDDPKFQEAITWWRSLIEKGYMPKLESTVGVELIQQVGAGNYAMVTEGSWNANAYSSITGVPTGIAPTPIGPSGSRGSVMNGLADSIWAGTDNQEASWQWVKFLASEECQTIVAEQGVVLPAIPAATDKAEAAFKAKNINMEGFTVQVDDKTTHNPPVTNFASQIQAIMQPAMDAVMGFQADVSSLNDANTSVNALFGG